MKATHVISFILVVIGGIDLGIIGIGEWAGKGLGWNVLNWIFGSIPWLEALIYVLIGIGALILIFTHKRDCKNCEASAPASSAPTM